jgi:hypothetical protein
VKRGEMAKDTTSVCRRFLGDVNVAWNYRLFHVCTFETDPLICGTLVPLSVRFPNSSSNSSSSSSINNINISSSSSSSSSRRGLKRRSTAARLLRSWVRIPPGAWMFVVNVVCCLVEVSATDWSFVQRSPTDCGASLCVIK